MNTLELEATPVIGEDGWVAFGPAVQDLSDDTPMQVVLDDGTAQEGHALEFKVGFLRAVPITGYKLTAPAE